MQQPKGGDVSPLLPVRSTANTLNPSTALREGKNLTHTVAEPPHCRVKNGAESTPETEPHPSGQDRTPDHRRNRLRETPPGRVNEHSITSTFHARTGTPEPTEPTSPSQLRRVGPRPRRSMKHAFRQTTLQTPRKGTDFLRAPLLQPHIPAPPKPRPTERLQYSLDLVGTFVVSLFT